MRKTAWVVGLTILFSIIVLVWWSRPIDSESQDPSQIAMPTLATTAKDGQIPNVVFDFLSAQYGEYLLKQKGWKTRDDGQPDSIARIYRICLDQTQINEQQVLRYLAVCASPFDGETLAHAESGLIDLLVWDESKKQALTTTRQIASGSYGQTGKVSLLQVGPQRFAFVIEDSYTGQGYSVTHQRFFSVLDTQLQQIAKVNLQRDNQGTLACASDVESAPDQSPLAEPISETAVIPPTQEGVALADAPIAEVAIEEAVEKEACLIEKYTVFFDQKSEHFGFYDLIVTQNLQENDFQIGRSETIKFDPKSQSYPIPAAFQQAW